MKKRLLSLLLTVVMVLGMLPVGVLADNTVDSSVYEAPGAVFQNDGEPVTAEVSFTAQADSAFLCAPQLDVEISGDLAESYGYTDGIDPAEGVSALDVLVKAHELLYDDYAENTTDYLNLNDSGFITTVFGENTSAFGFTVNGEVPNDGVLIDDSSAPGGKSYTGYTIQEAPVEDGDVLTFFFYQDSYYLDNYIWFEQDGSRCDALTVRPEAAVSLSIQGYCIAYYGCVPLDTLVSQGCVEAIDAVQLAWVSDETGALTDISGAAADENGTVTLTMPEDEGTYWLTAYMPAEEIRSNYATPVVLPLLQVVVDAEAKEPEKPVYGLCDLIALSVTDLNANPDALTLEPAFDKDVTAYSVETVGFQPYVKLAYVKATAANAEAVITASLNGTEKTITSGDASWTAFMNMEAGRDNVLTVTVAASDAEDAATKTYTVTIPMAPDPTAPALKGEAEAAAAIGLGETYTLDLTSVFTDADNPEALTYTVQVNDAAAESIGAQYSFRPSVPGVYTLVFTANDGKNNSPDYTVTLTVTAPDAKITVPADAALFVGSKTKHFVAFTEIPASVEMDNGDGTTTYYFELKDSSTYNYRVSGDGYITYAGTFRKTAGYALTVTSDQLQPEGKTGTTVDHDTARNSGYNVGDIYLNINAQGYLRLDAAGDTYQLVHLRNWEAIDSTTNNYFIEPDYHYTVLDLDGTAGSDVVTVSDSGVVTAVGEGTAIVLVTYDAMNIANAAGGPFFGAIWPENTGVFVVSVGAQESGIDTGMTLNAGKNSTDSKLAGDALDAEHDVIYFLGDAGSYTFTPGTAGVSVSVANPTVGDSMTFSGFEPVASGSDGSFTVPLAEGRNIVRLEKDGKTEYQVITAKAVAVTVNGKPLEEAAVTPGEALTIRFDTLYHPANKLAGVYNMSACIVYSDVEGYDGMLAGGTSNQYQFASKEAAQTISGFVKRTVGSWGMVSYSADKSTAFTVPEDWAEDTFTLSGGTLVALGYGDPYGNHRAITLTDGKGPNFSATVKEAYLGQLPDLVIPVAEAKSVESVEITTLPDQTAYFAGETFIPDGMVVKATYTDGSVNTQVKNYTVSPVVLTAGTKEVIVTYGGKTAAVPVTVTQPKATSVAITQAPVKTSYTEGEVFNPTGMVVQVTYENGVVRETTEYAYTPNRALETGDTAMTITYTGADAAAVLAAQQAIDVLPAPASGTDPDVISVYFKLMGDAQHDSESDGEVHTLAGGGLETWIARTKITVEQGATVLDVIEKALGLHGIPFENASGDYISEVRGLAEFDNGSLSGWMYTLNGSYPDLGVSEQTVKNGDSIVFHYTDDYTREESSEVWNGDNSGNSAVPGVKPAEPAEIPFTDIEGHWGSQAVLYVYEQGLMDGVGNGCFDPDGTLTRAMLVTILWRMEQCPIAGSAMPYTDVPAGTWYTEAVRWAAEQGIVNGVDETHFDPDGQITREQIAAMLWRYAQSQQLDTAAAENSLSGYADENQISAYAVPAMEWACSAKLIQGRGTNALVPQGSATRAEAATILMRYFSVISE